MSTAPPAGDKRALLLLVSAVRLACVKAALVLGKLLHAQSRAASVHILTSWSAPRSYMCTHDALLKLAHWHEK